MKPPPFFTLPVPLAKERLELRLPIDDIRGNYRVCVGRAESETFWIGVVFSDPISRDIGAFSGTHYECEVWLNGWLHAMSYALTRREKEKT